MGEVGDAADRPCAGKRKGHRAAFGGPRYFREVVGNRVGFEDHALCIHPKWDIALYSCDGRAVGDFEVASAEDVLRIAGVIDGFGARTREVAALLRDPATVFMIVTSPESEPAREAAFLARTLDARGMRRGGLIVNRVHSYALDGQPPERVRELLAPAVGERLAARAAANLADFDVLAERDRRAIARLQRELRVADPVLVPHLDQDVQDLAALARFAGYLLS